MPDIRAEDRVELGAERVALAERGRVHPVVGLAAEIERLGVEVEPVLLPGDLARREIVELGAVAGQILRVGVGQPSRALSAVGDIVVAVLLDQLISSLRSSFSGFMRSSAGAPRRSQCSIRSPNSWQAQPTPPSRKAKRSSGKRRVTPPRKMRLGDGVAGGGEMADMVVDEVRRRVAQPLAAGARMEGRRDAELDAFLPDRVVIVRAVDAEHVVPDARSRCDFGVVRRSPPAPGATCRCRTCRPWSRAAW